MLGVKRQNVKFQFKKIEFKFLKCALNYLLK